MKTMAMALALALGCADVSVAQCAPGQCLSGSLVQNGSFEDGVVGELPVKCEVEKESGAEGAVCIDSKQAHSGKQSVLVQMTSPSGYLHPDLSATLKPGFYLFRIWAKLEPQQSFLMEIYDFSKKNKLDGDGVLSREQTAINGEWSKYETEVEVTAEFQASIQIGLRKPGKLWLDDVEIIPSERKPSNASAGTTQARPAVLLWDLGRHSATPLTSEQLARRDGWKTIDKLDAKLEGDVCLSNKYLSAVFRKGSRCAELYYPTAEGFSKAATFLPIGEKGERTTAFDSMRVVCNTVDQVILDAFYKGEKGSQLGLRIICAPGNAFVETQPLFSTSRARIEYSAPVGIMPDLVGNDLLITAAKTSAQKLRLPPSQQTDFLHFIDNGNAILMCVWQHLDQQATVELNGDGAKRALVATEIEYNKVKCENVWIAMLAAPGIWHQAKVSEIAPAGTKLDWKMPFDDKVMWRADFRRDPDGLVESWFAIRQGKDGTWPGCMNKTRTVWTTFCTQLPHPAYIDGEAMCLANSTFENALTNTCYKEQGDISFNAGEDAIIYPYDNSSSSPANPLFAREVLRSALSDTPEAYLHALAYPQRIPSHRFQVTCATTPAIEKIFEGHEEMVKSREVLKLARQIKYFVVTVRERVETQLEWSLMMRAFCASQKAANPKLAPLANAFDETAARIPAIYQKQLPAMKQPAVCAEYTEMIEEILFSKSGSELVAISQMLRTLGQEIKPEEEKDRAVLVRALGKLIRTLAGAQDGTTGRMRQVVKALHQQAGISALTVMDDASFDFIVEVRARTTEAMSVYGEHERGPGMRYW